MPRQVYPMTAVLKVDPPSGLRLELHDPLVERRVLLDGRPEPLAADLTTPLVYHFVQSPLPVLQEIGLLDPQWLEKLAGLYMLHPYEPGKIPVVLVHGLRSSPAAWMKVINDLRGDPTLRDRYQFWLFMYPTGTPFPASAATLRSKLDELRAVDRPGSRRSGARPDGAGRPQHGRPDLQDDDRAERRRSLEAHRPPPLRGTASRTRAPRPAPPGLLLRAPPERRPGGLHRHPAPRERAGRPVHRPARRPPDPPAPQAPRPLQTAPGSEWPRLLHARDPRRRAPFEHRRTPARQPACSRPWRDFHANPASRPTRSSARSIPPCRPSWAATASCLTPVRTSTGPLPSWSCPATTAVRIRPRRSGSCVGSSTSTSARSPGTSPRHDRPHITAKGPTPGPSPAIPRPDHSTWVGSSDRFEGGEPLREIQPANLRRTSDVFCPPNPKLFERTTSTRRRRA